MLEKGRDSYRYRIKSSNRAGTHNTGTGYRLKDRYRYRLIHIQDKVVFAVA